MITVHVKPLAMLRDFLGIKETSIELDENSKVKNLLEALFRRFGNGFREKIMDPNSNQLKHHWVVMVNGNNINSLQKLDTSLKNDDDVLIFPPVAGG